MLLLVHVEGNNSSTSTELFRYSTPSSGGWINYKSTVNLNAISTPPTFYWYNSISSGSGECEIYLDEVSVYN